MKKSATFASSKYLQFLETETEMIDRSRAKKTDVLNDQKELCVFQLRV